MKKKKSICVHLLWEQIVLLCCGDEILIPFATSPLLAFENKYPSLFFLE